MAIDEGFRIGTAWRPLVGAAGRARLVVNLGEAPFVLSLEAAEGEVWRRWRESFNQKALFERQAEMQGVPLPADERQRGWPWVHTGYAAAAEACSCGARHLPQSQTSCLRVGPRRRVVTWRTWRTRLAWRAWRTCTRVCGVCGACEACAAEAWHGGGTSSW